MSKPREDLHKILVGIMHESYLELPEDEKSLTEDFTYNVYFQAPSRIHYPAIVYERSSADTQFADNAPYIYEKRYSITVITSDPDSKIPDKIAQLTKCLFDRHFVSENLHHDTFVLYY